MIVAVLCVITGAVGYGIGYFVAWWQYENWVTREQELLGRISVELEGLVGAREVYEAKLKELDT